MPQGFQKGHKGFRTPKSYKTGGEKVMGSKHGLWSENPAYGTIHQWLIRNYEKRECEHCGKKKSDGWKLHYALKKGKQYERKRGNFSILCASCHKKYDYTEVTKRKLSNYVKAHPVNYWQGKKRPMPIEVRKKISRTMKLKSI